MVAVVVAIAAAGGGGRKGVVCVGALTAMFVLLSVEGIDDDAVMVVVLPVEVDGSIEACAVGTVPTGTDIVAVAAGQGLLALLAWSTALVLWVCAAAVP